jgi:surfactin synthase thioesterase subunit
MKIIIFPFAGGNSQSFRKLEEKIASIASVKVIEYYRNNTETKLSSTPHIHSLIQRIFQEIQEDIREEPYIIYGHSMGGLIGYLICVLLQEKKYPMPYKLVIGGKKAPSIPRKTKIAHLPDTEFWNKIVALGGISKEIQNHKEIVDYYRPIIRHDFSISESYVYQQNPKLNIPIDVFYGSEENVIPSEINAWQDITSKRIAVTKLKGNHFFIFDHLDYFADYFKNLKMKSM